MKSLKSLIAAVAFLGSLAAAQAQTVASIAAPSASGGQFARTEWVSAITGTFSLFVNFASATGTGWFGATVAQIGGTSNPIALAEARTRSPGTLSGFTLSATFQAIAGERYRLVGRAGGTSVVSNFSAQVIAVPGPIAGAGLPLLFAAGLYGLVRRRKTITA